jgi:16S rRNA (guanine527-N7)-methyltransferase
MPIEINEQEFKSYITKTFAQNGLSSYLSQDKVAKFLALTKRMLEENEKYNLTAITDPKKIIFNHYADCVTLAAHIKKGASVIDVGCGAGFPTLPLALVREDIKILAMDSTEKRVNYVSETARLLGLENVEALTMRAEDGSKLPEYREKFDYATARAVAELRILSELCLPYVKVGGEFLAMKGKNAEFELNGAKKALAILGGKNPTCHMVNLKAEGEELSTHPIIKIAKGTKTPPTYPRPYAQISKKPL